MSDENIKFTLIEPLTITDVMFNDTLNEIPEPATSEGDPASAWVSGTTYALAARVRHQHKIYERLIAGAGTTAPDLDVTNWAYVSPVNRWKMFDASNSTQTVPVSTVNAGKSASFYVTLGASDYANTVVIDNCDLDTIRLIAYTPGMGSVVYDKTIKLRDTGASDWWGYYFEKWTTKSAGVFWGLPNIPGMVLAFTATRYAYPMKLGTVVIGTAQTIGGAQYGASVGIVDYSRKEVDAWGNASVVPRAYSKRMSMQVRFDSQELDRVVSLFAKYRATPAMYLGAGDQFASMLMFGYFKSFDIVIPAPSYSVCNIEIEGLTQ